MSLNATNRSQICDYCYCLYTIYIIILLLSINYSNYKFLHIFIRMHSASFIVVDFYTCEIHFNTVRLIAVFIICLGFLMLLLPEDWDKCIIQLSTKLRKRDDPAEGSGEAGTATGLNWRGRARTSMSTFAHWHWIPTIETTHAEAEGETHELLSVACPQDFRLPSVQPCFGHEGRGTDCLSFMQRQCWCMDSCHLWSFLPKRSSIIVKSCFNFAVPLSHPTGSRLGRLANLPDVFQFWEEKKRQAKHPEDSLALTYTFTHLIDPKKNA